MKDSESLHKNEAIKVKIIHDIKVKRKADKTSTS